jgi:hypothetical protein
LNCRADKDIRQLIKNKTYEYVKDYVVSALVLNVTESYIEIQKFLEDSHNNFGMENMENILNCINVEETKNIFELTCNIIPDLFLELYDDIVAILCRTNSSEIIEKNSLSVSEMRAFKERIVKLLMDEAYLFYLELDVLENIIEKLDLFIPKLTHIMFQLDNNKANDLNRYFIEFLDVWGYLIHKYHTATNLYLDIIYPTQVEVVYEELSKSLIKNIMEILEKLDPCDLNKAYTCLENYFNNLLE